MELGENLMNSKFCCLPCGAWCISFWTKKIPHTSPKRRNKIKNGE